MFKFCLGNVVLVSVNIGQLNTKPEVRVEKEEANPTYQTYGRKGEVDYAIDYNGDYQPSDYDEMYDTVGGGSIRRKVLVHLLCDDSMTHSFQVETETSQKSPKYCLVTVVTCVTMILLGLVGAVLHLTLGEESYLERHLYTKCFFSRFRLFVCYCYFV